MLLLTSRFNFDSTLSLPAGDSRDAAKKSEDSPGRSECTGHFGHLSGSSLMMARYWEASANSSQPNETQQTSPISSSCWSYRRPGLLSKTNRSFTDRPAGMSTPASSYAHLPSPPSGEDVDSLPSSDAGSSTSTSPSDEYDESDADREWRESLQQLELLLTMVLVPYLGKYFGRRFAYFSECPHRGGFDDERKG